jgi:hypothetical protein
MPAEKTKDPSTTVAVQVQHNAEGRGYTIMPRENSWHRFILGETRLYNLLLPDDSPAASKAFWRWVVIQREQKNLLLPDCRPAASKALRALDCHPARAKEFALAGRQSCGFPSASGAG